ncbi:MAG: 3'(2'),5'-bisphosphate nucleotidase CysQ [Spirochaetota bacterium]
MLTVADMHRLTVPLLRLALEAGAAILDVYESDDFETERKADDSPLTLADRRSHEKIDAGLRALAPGIPILSEEGHHSAYEERAGWDEFWLVDPLDGTKEFVKRNGEFTVNIALVQHGEPVLGIVYAPVREEAWAGIAPPAAASTGESGAAWKLAAATAAELPEDATIEALARPIRVRPREENRISIIASRTHLNDATRAFIDRATEGVAEVEILNVGSSLKLCYVAEGRADLYPRYAPTSEWDTAAGHAVVRAAGGEIYQAGPDADPAPDPGHTSHPLRYNKRNLLNPWFVVRAW